MKKLLIGVGIVLLVLVGMGVGGYTMMNRLGDLRTPLLKKGVTAALEAKGRALMGESIKAMGGKASWGALKRSLVRVKMEDLWKDGLMTRLMAPKDLSGHALEYIFRPDKEDSRLNFLEGKRKGSAWGVQNWVTYTISKGGKMHWKKDQSIKFFLPTYRFFLFMPFYLAEAPKLAYGGERKLKGKVYDLVYATWNDFKPQRSIDQYLVWIERKSKRVGYVQYTVRDAFASVISSAKAAEYKRVNGLLVPHLWTIMPKPGAKSWMHKIKVQSFEKATKLKMQGNRMPDPNKSGT